MTTELPANAAGRALFAVLALPEPARSVYTLTRIERWRFHDAATSLRLTLADTAHELVRAETALLRANDGATAKREHSRDLVRAKLTDDEIAAHIAHRLKLARLTAGKSQSEFGAALGVTYQQIQKYEYARDSLTAAKLWRVAQLYTVPVSFFFAGLEPEAPETPEGPSYGPGMRVGAMLDKLPPNVALAIAALVSAAANAEPQS